MEKRRDRPMQHAGGVAYSLRGMHPDCQFRSCASIRRTIHIVGSQGLHSGLYARAELHATATAKPCTYSMTATLIALRRSWSNTPRSWSSAVTVVAAAQIRQGIIKSWPEPHPHR